DDIAMNFHAVGSGRGTNGSTSSDHTADPATTVAVSSIGWPPCAFLSNAFQPACSKPAPSTASVTPSVSSEVKRAASGGVAGGGVQQRDEMRERRRGRARLLRLVVPQAHLHGIGRIGLRDERGRRRRVVRAALQREAALR